MKFKTRLRVTFLAIVLIPLVLTVTAFFIIGISLVKERRAADFGAQNAFSFADTVETVGGRAQFIYDELMLDLLQNPLILENKEYLENVTQNISSGGAYIIVRKGDALYYTGNAKAADKIFSRLSDFEGKLPDEKSGYYLNDLQKYVKQLNFWFSDGTPGSLFIVTGVNTLVSKSLLINMAIAFFIILLFTSFLLTGWIHQGVFEPVNQLNIAMKKIKDGNFEYRLETGEKGEIGDLYRNYEDMRLRLKETTEEKVEQERKNKELISNITHDLKTPITAIKGYMEGILDGVADTPEKVEKYVRTVYNKANDMDQLINQLTIYSGIDTSRMPYNFREINVADYFGDCAEEVGLDLEEKKIKLNYENLVSPDAVIIADPEQMKRVVNNIIGNSIKYMDKQEGVIDIRILDEVDSIRVEIEDNGKGIAAKDLPRIFERLYRTDTSRNSSTGGSGIGLSIVKKIIEDHGGYIWATSKEKEGTCMHFVIRKYKERPLNEA